MDVKTPGDGLPDVANSERPVLHFTLNHYMAFLQRTGFISLTRKVCVFPEAYASTMHHATLSSFRNSSGLGATLP